MGQFRDFLKMLAGQPTEAQKALTVTLAPNGFVNEIMTTIVAPRATSGGAWASSAQTAVDTATLQQIMALNELVYACIKVKATSARDPRLVVQKQVTKNGKIEYEEVAGHPFRALFTRPNPLMTESDLMAAAIVSWDASNPRRFYCEKVYTGSLLTELWPLNPACMTPRYNQDRTEVTGYTWSDGRRRRDYTLDELLIRSAPAWYDPPPLVAALGSAGADTEQTRFISDFFEGGGIPPFFLKYSMALNQEQRDEIRAKYRSIQAGASSSEPGILDSNSDVVTVGSRLDQIGSQTLRSVSESRICMVFGVPPLIVYAYVGLIRATYSNLKEAWAGFWDATMSPAFKEWRDFWMWSLLVEFEEERDIRSERIRLNYDMSQVAALQDDVDAIQKRSRENFQARLISQNEARSAIGYAPTAGGDETYYSPSGQAAPPPIGKQRKSRDDPSVQVVERRMEQMLKKYLNGQYEAAASGVE